MEKDKDKSQLEFETKNRNAISLAFIGDCVWSLKARVYVCNLESLKQSLHHSETNKFVCATFQAKLVMAIKDGLTPFEDEIFLRARNASTNNVPKHASLEEYKKATSLEAIIGYNYLIGNSDRIDEIFNIAVQLLNNK